MNYLSMDTIVFPSLQFLHQLNNTGGDVSYDTISRKFLGIENIASPPKGCADLL